MCLLCRYSTAHDIRRNAVEHWREVNGWLRNSHRDTRSNLQAKFGAGWDFTSGLDSEGDESWSEETLEDAGACAQRGYRGLLWVLQQPEDSALVVAHGGIFSFLMDEPGHPLVRMLGENEQAEVGAERRQQQQKHATGTARFGNCELREYILSCENEPASLEWERSPTVFLRPVPAATAFSPTAEATL